MYVNTYYWKYLWWFTAPTFYCDENVQISFWVEAQSRRIKTLANFEAHLHGGGTAVFLLSLLSFEKFGFYILHIEAPVPESTNSLSWSFVASQSVVSCCMCLRTTHTGRYRTPWRIGCASFLELMPDVPSCRCNFWRWIYSMYKISNLNEFFFCKACWPPHGTAPFRQSNCSYLYAILSPLPCISNWTSIPAGIILTRWGGLLFVQKVRLYPTLPLSTKALLLLNPRSALLDTNSCISKRQGQVIVNCDT